MCLLWTHLVGFEFFYSSLTSLRLLTITFSSFLIVISGMYCDSSLPYFELFICLICLCVTFSDVFFHFFYIDWVWVFYTWSLLFSLYPRKVTYMLNVPKWKFTVSYICILLLNKVKTLGDFISAPLNLCYCCSVF